MKRRRVKKTRPTRAYHLALFVWAGCLVGCTSFSPMLPMQPAGTRHEVERVALPPTREESAEREDRLIQAVLENPDDPDAYDRLGYLQHRMGRRRAALDSYRAALRLDPNRARTRLRLARLWYEIGEIAHSRREVERTIQLDRTLGDAYSLRGRLLLDEGRNDAAMEAFAVGWRCDPPSVSAGLELARFQLEREHWQESADLARACRLQASNHPDALRIEASALEKSGKLADSIDRLQTVVASGEGKADDYFKLCRLSHGAGNWKAAYGFFEQGRRLAPNHPQVVYLENVLSSAAQEIAISDPYPPLKSRK